MTGFRMIRYAPGGEPLAEIEWRGVGDYTVISGKLDESGKEIADVAFLPGFVDGYCNVGDAYEGQPYWGWPNKDACA
ncbi:MAG: hypothetical protein KatS3mg075_435 [Meiothermus sp.]|uniref:Uncharacterized protein n=1 Tax=Meiothermus ruber TaxID=277 RepID=A0A7C3HU05_MEIRU|nr:MAG: hypothetical protein KatS3mg075_435 [Meiothermus sp.]